MVERAAVGPTLSDTVASAVREMRRSQGLTAQDLARRCAEAGACELTAAAIFNLETGRRGPDGRRRRRRKLDERAEDRALQVQAAQAEIEAKAPAKPVCQCGHGLAFHDPKASKCAEAHNAKSGTGTCLCRRYIGPEPLAQFYAPELTDLEGV